MCGRFVQYQGVADYLKVLAADRLIVSGYDNHPIGRYNIAPSTRVNILHNQQNNLRIDSVRWGWAPLWAKGKRPDPINARVETVTNGKFFKQLWPDSRALVMADGWYEWVKDPDYPKKKQPYFIRLKTQAPMFFAALAEVHTGLEPHEGDGFVIITAASDQGMVDIHDRRPVVFSPEHAREWMENDLDQTKAEELALNCCQPTKDFEWYPVGNAVGNVKNQGPELVMPLKS
nr:SOS response-associated peptidase family protein [uncultured Pseudomonas sp.]